MVSPRLKGRRSSRGDAVWSPRSQTSSLDNQNVFGYRVLHNPSIFKYMGAAVAQDGGQSASECVKISIVVPAFNEQDGLEELYRRTSLAAREAVGSNYELILVDDGSQDKTWAVIEHLAARDPRVVGIKLSRNHGHQLALTAGLSQAQGELIFVIDADLQDPPELLSQMRDRLIETGSDVVYGVRRSRAGESRFKTWTAKVFYRLLAKATDIAIPVDAGDFRIMTRRTSEILVRMPERDRFIRGMVAWIGLKQTPFEYDRSPRFSGVTKYSWRRMIRFATDAFLSFSMVPIKFAGYLTSLVFLGMACVAVYAIYGWMSLGVVPGWTSLTLLILLLSGIQMSLLRVVSEYVGRIYLEGKARPLFIIDTIVRLDRVSRGQTTNESIRQRHDARHGRSAS